MQRVPVSALLWLVTGYLLVDCAAQNCSGSTVIAELASLVNTPQNKTEYCPDSRAKNYVASPPAGAHANHHSCEFDVVRAEGSLHWESVAAFCKLSGYSNTVVGRTDCYRDILSNRPVWHRPLDTINQTCNPSSSCVSPFAGDVHSVSINGLVVNDHVNSLTINVHYFIGWADARLLGTQISSAADTWKPSLVVEGFLVSDKVRRLVEISQKANLDGGLQWSKAENTFVFKKSSTRCATLDHCSVHLRGSQRKELKLRKVDYTKFPFDSHQLRFDILVKHPYGFLDSASKADQDAWGYTKLKNGPHEMNWKHAGTTKHVNSDGSEIEVPVGLYESLRTLEVSGWSLEFDVKFDHQDEKFEILLMIHRASGKFVQRFVFPLVLITLIGTNVAWLPSTQIGPRNQVCLIGLLTAVAFANGAAGSAPQSITATWFDLMTVSSIAAQFLSVFENFLVAYCDRSKRPDLSLTIDRVARWVLPVFFFQLMIIITASFIVSGGWKEALIDFFGVAALVAGAVAIAVWSTLQQRKLKAAEAAAAAEKAEKERKAKEMDASQGAVKPLNDKPQRGRLIKEDVLRRILQEHGVSPTTKPPTPWGEDKKPWDEEPPVPFPAALEVAADTVLPGSNGHSYRAVNPSIYRAPAGAAPEWPQLQAQAPAAQDQHLSRAPPPTSPQPAARSGGNVTKSATDLLSEFTGINLKL
eukprot:CAMPEP_0114546906 /NCGR_PEP_ID=MMETSP0114-20121206/4181_1 /TAXON_ID=31324 /ORGANISM="Goniomonas sp, Strain m" /LENGTH=697 /DNA_ID=CAMNT_0001731427 /DNA_START=13 /DNA_END=2106 /DNA_ORIENTATION=-